MTPLDTLGLSSEIAANTSYNLTGLLATILPTLFALASAYISHKYNTQHVNDINTMRFDALQKETRFMAEITALKNELNECKEDFERHKRGEG